VARHTLATTVLRARARAVALACAALFGLCACGGPPADTQSAAPTPTPAWSGSDGSTPESALDSISESALRDSVAYLASPALAGRGSGQGEDLVAAAYVEAVFTRSGLEPMGESGYEQRVVCQGPNGYTLNVLGAVAGRDPAHERERVVVGAHYDHLGRRNGQIYPGADDNASGTAVLLALAEAVGQLAASGTVPRRSIVFAAFSAEEQGLVGSRRYVDSIVSSSRLPLCMVNADMVGHLANRSLYLFGVANGSALGTRLSTICRRHTAVPPQLVSSAGGGSDHVPFAAAGVPVVFLHTGLHPRYHTPQDTADTLDYPGLTAMARITLELVWYLAAAERPDLPSVPPLPFDSPEWQADHGRAPFSRALP
jgi:hypothetical protein